MADLKEAEATRDGQAQASADLDRFYASVLPADFVDRAPHDARRSWRSWRARTTWISRAARRRPETLRDSTLERLNVNYSLTGRLGRHPAADLRDRDRARTSS